MSCHLDDEAFARQDVCESGVVVVLIEDGDEGRACGTAWGRAAVLDQHRQLITWLLLPVQNGPSADLTWRQKKMGEFKELFLNLIELFLTYKSTYKSNIYLIIKAQTIQSL